MEKERKKRTNKKTKSKGNGEGTFYFSEKLQKWVAQYVEPFTGKRKTLTQRKGESKKEFVIRFTKIMNDINQGTYVAKSCKSVLTLAKDYAKQKHLDGITSSRSYKRDLETIAQIEKTCSNFCNLPIQKVTIEHIECAKEEIKEYANNTIGKIWGMLKKVFNIACSPSRQILVFNLMQDPNLNKPLSNKKTKKVKPLSQKEFNKLNDILDNQELNHPYRNIVKMQLISGMRIRRSFSSFT